MNVLYYVYAVLLLLGGLLGFVRARSAPSLAASAVAAILIAWASLRMHTHPRSSLLIGLVVSLVLGAFFAGRYQVTKKPMPALPVLAVSAIVLIASVLRLIGVHM